MGEAGSTAGRSSRAKEHEPTTRAIALLLLPHRRPARGLWLRLRLFYLAGPTRARMVEMVGFDTSLPIRPATHGWKERTYRMEEGRGDVTEQNRHEYGLRTVAMRLPLDLTVIIILCRVGLLLCIPAPAPQSMLWRMKPPSDTHFYLTLLYSAPRSAAQLLYCPVHS